MLAPTSVVHVPDGIDVDAALARTTDLGIAAHPDDLELDLLPGVVHCVDDPDRWFTGVVCTDGAGSVRVGPSVEMTDDELVAERWAEQCRAADLGRYGAVVGLGHASAHVRGDGHDELVDQLVDLLLATRPMHVFTHNLADKHQTHLAVAAAAVQAVRRLDPADRPYRLVGCEGWRDLDWLPDGEKVLLDVSGFEDLADELAVVFASQIEGAKRYDLAAAGRRRANATMQEPRALDRATQVVVAMDLSPLVHNPDIDPVRFVLAAVDRFRAEVERDLGRWLR
ncbi:MAG: PIG-L family deacetylase [Acidimicrobiales bacterium]